MLGVQIDPQLAKGVTVSSFFMWCDVQKSFDNQVLKVDFDTLLGLSSCKSIHGKAIIHRCRNREEKPLKCVIDLYIED